MILKLNEIWDMGELVDLGAGVDEGMTICRELFPPVHISELDLSSRAKERGFMTYSQHISMCGQVSTYLETGAHLHPEMEKINEVGLDRLFVSAVVLQIPRRENEIVTVEDIENEMSRVNEKVSPGEALIISTGFNFLEHKDLNDSPHFSYSAVEYAVKHKCSILGSDMSSWQDPNDKKYWAHMFFESGTLLLAPLVNLTKISVPRIKMIVMPLKIQKSCASPCRVIAVVPSGKISGKI
ncbi:MAG: cyclase family protein [Firmicutes bacterium]|nr:cyclase family protein [Bacillota bacterium]